MIKVELKYHKIVQEMEKIEFSDHFFSNQISMLIHAVAFSVHKTVNISDFISWNVILAVILYSYDYG